MVRNHGEAPEMGRPQQHWNPGIMAITARLDGIAAVHAAIRLAQANAKKRPYVSASHWDKLQIPSHGVREQLTPLEKAIIASF